MKDVMRSYCVSVLLGTPNRHTFSILLGLCRRSKLLWLTDRAPLYARLMGVTVLSPPTDSASILRELWLIAEQHEGKMLTLLPATENMTNFVEKNKEQLEQNYRFAVSKRK
jgi:hypothetical protein